MAMFELFMSTAVHAIVPAAVSCDAPSGCVCGDRLATNFESGIIGNSGTPLHLLLSQRSLGSFPVSEC